MSGIKPELYPVRSSGPKPLHFRGLTLGRLDRFEGGEYSDINLTSTLYEARIDSTEYITIESWSSPGRTKTPFNEAIRQKFTPAKKGDQFGPSWTHHWFRITLTLPPEWANKERVQFEWDPGCEAMFFNTDGLSLQGITGGYGGDRRVDFILDPELRGSTYRYYIEVSCNGMFGNGSGEVNNPPDDNRYFTLASADLVVPHMPSWRLLWDFRTLKDLAKALPDNSPLGTKCMETANSIMNVFKHDDPSTIDKARKLAERVFGDDWEKVGEGIYDGEPGDSFTWGIGNCHIDTAWLWPYSATRQKTARSWSTQVDLMNRYPEFTFVASQAQQFAWLEKDYPLLFHEIKGKVDEGKFQPIGGCWVECDTNMPSGEALCRQFLYGQRFYKSRFGKYTRTFWLPDSFGYSSQLPQLCRLAGLDFFFTQKLSWSQFNAPVHTSFQWVGQDGSQVLTHMTPVNTYTAQASVDDVRNSLNNHKSLQSGAANALLAFGNGDGGGGPLAPMIENLRRCRAVANHSGELPKVTMGQSVDLFYEDILKKTENGKTLPTWNGELYLELHRGTATSHGAIKKGNRKSEILLREVEYAATLASTSPATKTTYSYPKDKIDPLWENVLLNQFHDVLPGSGIGMIYVDAEAIYAEVAEKAGALLEEALQALLPGSKPASDEHAAGDELVAVNTTPFPRREIAKIPLAAARALSDAAVQSTHDGCAYVLLDNTKGDAVVSATSWSALEAAKVPAARARAIGEEFVLSNGQLKIVFNKKGRITSIVDLELNRELIEKGKSAGFVIFEDRPLNWDAWDVDLFHLETKSDVDATSIKVLEDGPLRSTIQATYHVGDSIIKAAISLDAVAPVAKADALSLIRFDTEVKWHEKHQFLKWEIPLDISSEFATFENQFGFCQRPTNRNTTWDRAKFEVVGHKFADLSEFGYGVALLNDCKYGYAAEGSTLRLSLLRAATVPDAHQDQGNHTFSFAVLPHRGSFAESDVPIAGWIFNSPQHLRRIPHARVSSAVAVGHPFKLKGTRNIILDTIKRAEDDHFGVKSAAPQTVVLRLYEAFGGHGSVDVLTELDVESVTICDILERDLEELPVIQTKTAEGEPAASVKINFRGFQVISLKFTLGVSPKKAGSQWVAL
ncbi:alpha-mannosidase [Meredithblackwellia eburnea MCA 4105]